MLDQRHREIVAQELRQMVAAFEADALQHMAANGVIDQAHLQRKVVTSDGRVLHLSVAARWGKTRKKGQANA